MNRPTEYRVWNEPEKEMMYITLSELCDPAATDARIFMHNFPDAPRMEWTGLTDKNGTKIFEGDIIRAKNEDAKYYKTDVWEVRFEGGTFIAFADNERNETWLPFWNAETEIEILGNLYQHAHLLKREEK